MKIIICTQGSVGISIIRKLFELRFKPCDITIITYDINESNNRLFISYLDFLNIEWFETGKDMNKLADIILLKNASVLLSVSYKYIFKSPVLDLPNVTLINLHPGRLPDYRGCFLIPWAIINDEASVEYTYHLINEVIDGGDIILRERFPVFPSSTAFDLHFKVMNSAINSLEYVFFSNWQAYPQIGEGRYYKNIFPTIDPLWDNHKIDRFKRATYFPPYHE